MNRSVLILIVAMVLSVTVPAMSAETNTGEGAVIESISYEKDEENLEKIVFKLNGTHIPKIFKIKGEKPRLVFDFIDTRYSDLINNIINTEGNLIKGVRVGIHNDPPKTRVVVDLKPEEKYKFEQDFLLQENILSITFHPAEQKKAEDKVAVQPVKKEEKPAPGQEPAIRKEPPRDQSAISTTPAPEKKKDEAAWKQQGKEAPKGSSEKKAERAAQPAEDEKKSVPEAKAVENPILAQITKEEQELPDPLLSNVSFEKTANDSEMVLFKLNDFYPPIVFGIEKGNPRVVCDFLDTDLAESVRSVIQTKGTYVSRVRTALHDNPHKVRVVLDLVPNRNYDLQQVFFKEDNLFVIIINEFEEESVQAPDIPESPARIQ